jgi:hypothetical protein
MITKQEILDKVAPEVVASKDEAAIAAAFSVGRTKLVKTEVGVGLILNTLGVAAGNAFLDVIFTHSDFRYVKLLVEKGTLDVSLQITRDTIDSLVPTVLTSEQAESLKNLAVVPDSVSAYEIAAAFERG